MKQFRYILLSSPLYALAWVANAEENAVPQMDQTWYPNQLFWLAVSFVLLYAIVSKNVAPRMARILGERETALHDAIREAEAAKNTAAATRSHAESEGASARNKAAEFIQKAHTENIREATNALAKLDQELERKLDQADIRIRQAKEDAMDSLRAATVDLTAAVAGQLLGRSLKPSDVEFAVPVEENESGSEIVG